MPKADWRPARLKSWNFLAGVDSPWPRISLPSRRPMARSISNSRNIEQWLRWKQESYLSSGLITIGEIRMHLPWNDPFFKWCERMLKKLAADLMTPLPNDNLNKRIIMKIIFEVNFFVHVVSLCCFHNSHFKLETIPGVGIASSRLFCCFWRGIFRNRLLFWKESLQMSCWNRRNRYGLSDSNSFKLEEPESEPESLFLKNCLTSITFSFCGFCTRGRPNMTPGSRDPDLFGHLGSGRWDPDV